MVDFYVAPSYRGYSILRGPYTKDRKEYAIIDFKGKEKEIRIYRQPQKSWKEPARTPDEDDFEEQTMDKMIDRALFNELLSKLCDRCDMYWVDDYCKKNCKWAEYHFDLEKSNKEED